MASRNALGGYQFTQVYKLKGHDAAVISCASTGSRIISGAEDGRLLLHDLLSPHSDTASRRAGSSSDTSATQCMTDRPMTANPDGTPPYTNPSTAAAPLPATKPLMSVQLTGPDGMSATVAAVAVSASSPETSVFAAAASRIHQVDFRTGGVVQTYDASHEEINGLSVSSGGSHLAAGDDGGEVQVYDLTAGRPFKCIRNVHRSICSSVAFRAHKPWELLTGGLDATVAKYDFSRPKCMDRWEMNALSASAGGSGGGGAQVFNPPFVHQIAVPPQQYRPRCQWVAAARGDGAVVVLDADVSSSGPTTQVAAGCGSGARPAGGGGKGTVAGWGRDRQPLVLDRDCGGHTLPVCSVVFAPEGSVVGMEAEEEAGAAAVAAALGPGKCRLYSGGEDCRVIAWDVRAALEARAAVGGMCGSGEESGGAGCVERGALQGGGEQVDGESGSGDGGQQGRAKGDRHSAMIAEVRHGRKVNQICALGFQGQELVAVAAVSKFVAVYRFESVQGT